MNQEESKKSSESQISYENNSELIDILPASQAKYALQMLCSIMNLIKKRPSYKFEIARTGYKCIGNFVDKTTYCISATKQEAKGKNNTINSILAQVGLSLVNMMINDDQYGVVVKQLLKNEYNFEFSTDEPSEERKESNETFLRRKREREKDDPEEIASQCNHKYVFFELAVLRWELTHLLDESTTVNLNSFKNTVNLMMLKFKLNTPYEASYSQVGSLLSNTLRNNNTTIDFYISVKQCNDLMYNEFIDCVYNDANNNNYSIDYLSNEKYIQIAYKPFICTIRLLDYNQSKIMSTHASFISKHKMTQNDTILIKLFKSWRRNLSLFFLPPEVIEFFVLNQQEDQSLQGSKSVIMDRAMMFFKSVIEIEKKPKEQWSYLLLLVTPLLASNSNIKTLIVAAENSLDKIETNKYDDLF